MESKNLVSESKMTPESTFIEIYARALNGLQGTWLNGHTDEDAFEIQIEFLRSLIPDESIRKKILDEKLKKSEDVKNGVYGASAKKHSSIIGGMAVVPHIVEFVCQTCDLIHIDIGGPATSKQYRDAAVEIPDAPKKEITNDA